MRSESDASGTRVWFADQVREGASELVVEAPDRLGVLFAVVTAIVGARVKILRSEATIANGIARDWFLVAEPDGRSLGAARREHLCDDVRTAILSSSQRDAA
jgi:UTP:GlnB (protein PII) uridylyltransferase